MSSFYDEVPETYGPAEPKQPQSQLEARVEALEQQVQLLDKKVQFWLHQPWVLNTSMRQPKDQWATGTGGYVDWGATKSEEPEGLL